jgi:hypothetical protein
MASVTFKEGNQNPSPESRTMVKQNGAWKILNMSILENGSYLLADAYNNMKAFVGKWEYENNSFTVEPDNGMKPVMARFEFKETPTGLVQLSDVSYTSNNQSFVVPTECEYFIPDYNQNEIKYMDIQKNTSGQTFTNMGKVTSEQPNSFTVKSMFADKPTAVQFEYTVTLKDGKWHQVAKSYARDGKQTNTFTFEMHRM